MNADATPGRHEMPLFPMGWTTGSVTETSAPWDPTARPWRGRVHSRPPLSCALPQHPADLRPLLSTPARSSEPQPAIAVTCGYPLRARLMNGFFCVSVWVSLLLAIWLTRGWLGLIVSGQALSAVAFLLKVLARQTQLAFSHRPGSMPQLRGGHHVS
jgi:hypothetical protein